MKNALFLSSAALLFFLFTAINCTNTSSTPQAQLQNIELLRGDLILCSGKEFGDVKFSLSCEISVRETFDLALSLLHSFQYSEAEKAFVKVLDVDPECAMAYWGVAMSIYHAAWFPPSEIELTKASKILQIANTLEKTEQEKDYLNAIGAFYEDWNNVDHVTRAKKYEVEMERLYLKYSEDTEAAILYTLALYSTRDRTGKDYSNEKKAGAILEKLFQSQSNHPGIAHYIIHNYDNPELAPKALQVARRYADIAPGSAHAQHMPSHIFTRLGLWEESIQSNLNSISSVQCYVEKAGMIGHYFEEIHAMDYMVYAYLQKGDNASAEQQLNNLNRMNEFYPMMLTAVAYPIASIPTRLALENKDWQAAANLDPNMLNFEWKQFPWQKAILHFGRALGACHTSDFASAEEDINTLMQLKQDLIDQNDKTKTSQIDQIEIQIKTAQAWREFKSGREEEGLKLMMLAADLESKTSKHPVTPGDVLPADELLGEMLLLMDRPEEALMAFEKNLLARPNRFNGLYGAAVAAKRAGRLTESKGYFKSLLANSEMVESDRIEILEAKSLIAQL